MRVCGIALVYVCVVIFIIWLASCAIIPIPTFPHRTMEELFPQANSPPAECPGQYKMVSYLYDENMTFFVYCWGVNN